MKEFVFCRTFFLRSGPKFCTLPRTKYPSQKLMCKPEDTKQELVKILKRIGKKSIDLEEEWNKKRPLLCYALHPDVLNDEDYEKLCKPDINKAFYDLLSKFNPCEGGSRPRGIIVFLIRKFFEESNGGDYWQVWGLSKDLKKQENVRECFRSYDEQNLIGGNDDKDLAGESSSLREYLKFHCWALKCDEENGRKGVSSTRIKVNKDYHAKLEGSCESEKMERILAADSRDEVVGESEDPPKYVECLLSGFWQEYLLSLCCVAAPENDKNVEELIDDNKWKWLKPLVGLAPSKEAQGNWSWHLIDSRGDCYLDSEGLKDEYQYKQSSDDSSDDKRSVEQEEIDPTKETEVLKDEKTIGRIKNLSKIVTPIGDFVILPSPLRRNSEKFYLLHRNSDAPQIVVGDDQKQEAEKNPNTREIKNCYGNGWYCTEYALPCANADGLSLYVTIDGQGPYPLLDLQPKFKVCNEVLYLKGKEIHIVKPEGSDRVVRIDPKDTSHDIEWVVKAPEGCKIQKDEQSYIIHLPDRHSYDGYLELLDPGENKIEKIKIYVLPDQMEDAFAKGNDWYKNIYKHGVEVWREKDTNGKLGTIELPLSETKWWWKRKRDGEPIEGKNYITSSLREHEEDELYFRSPCECDLCFECAGERFTLESAQNRRRRQLRYILGDIDKKVKGNHPMDIKLLIVEKKGKEKVLEVLDAPYSPPGPEVDLDNWQIIGRNLDTATGRLVIEHEKFYYSSEQEKAHYRIEKELSELQYDQGERIIMPALPNDWSDDCIVCYFEQDSGATPFGWVLKNPKREEPPVERIEKSGNNALSNIVPHFAWLWQNRHQPLYKSIIDYVKRELEETVQEEDFKNACQSLIKLLNELNELKRDGWLGNYLTNGYYRPYICEHGVVDDKGSMCLVAGREGMCEKYYSTCKTCLLVNGKADDLQRGNRKCNKFPEEEMAKTVKEWFLPQGQEEENTSIDSIIIHRQETTFKKICETFAMKETAVERIVALINEGEDDMLRRRMYAVFSVVACVMSYWEKDKDFSHLGRKLPQTFMEIYKRESEALKIRVCSFMHYLKNLA